MYIRIPHVVVCGLQLARYLNRTYWEKKQEEVRKSPTPSAPAPVPLAEAPMPISQPVETHTPVNIQPVNIVEVYLSPEIVNRKYFILIVVYLLFCLLNYLFVFSFV